MRNMSTSDALHNNSMAKLQVLSVFLTERLTLAAQEIFKAVEDIVSEYNDEMCRSRREIDLLRKRLQQAGLHLDSELQYSSIESQETQTLSDEQWRTEQGGKNAEVKMKVEVHALPEENEVQMFVYNESSSLVACMDTGHDQMANKDIENQIMNTNENDFPFTNQAAEIKNEPGLYSVENRECQLQHFTSHSSDDPEASDASSINKTEVVNFDCLGHKNQAFNLPPRTQERLMHHRVELAQIRERLASNEQKKAATKARAIKHKLKIYGNPELLEAYRKKERESKLQTQRDQNQGNDFENDETHRVKTTGQPEEVQLHKEQLHQTQPRMNLADICLEDIQHEEELSENYHTHHDMHGGGYGTGDYFCVVCQRRFSSAGLLKIHLRIHSGEKPYHCSFCGKNFRQSSHLNTHVRIHTGERPHICQNCGRTFIDSSARNRHFKKCILIALQGQ